MYSSIVLSYKISTDFSSIIFLNHVVRESLYVVTDVRIDQGFSNIPPDSAPNKIFIRRRISLSYSIFDFRYISQCPVISHSSNRKMASSTIARLLSRNTGVIRNSVARLHLCGVSGQLTCYEKFLNRSRQNVVPFVSQVNTGNNRTKSMNFSPRLIRCVF